MKRKAAFYIFTIFLWICLLSGCRIKVKYPFYQIEIMEDNTEVLTINGVRYRRDWEGNEGAMDYNGGDVWTLSEGLGDQIGICSKKDSGGEFDIYGVTGDDNLTFLYTSPHYFYFGGRDVRLWMREGVSLGDPAVEMVSRVTAVWSDDDIEPRQTDDPELIAALLNAYAGSSDEAVKITPEKGKQTGCKLILHHVDYPFLQYEIHCCYSLEKRAAYCQNDDLEWFPLPEEWLKIFEPSLT